MKYNRLTLSVWNLRPTGVFVLNTLDLPQLFICKDRHYSREKDSCVVWVDVHGQFKKKINLMKNLN